MPVYVFFFAYNAGVAMFNYHYTDLLLSGHVCDPLRSGIVLIRVEKS